jgi:hypothetical protein
MNFYMGLRLMALIIRLMISTLAVRLSTSHQVPPSTRCDPRQPACHPTTGSRWGYDEASRTVATRDGAEIYLLYMNIC